MSIELQSTTSELIENEKSNTLDRAYAFTPNLTKTFKLMLSSNLVTIVLTMLPVLVKLPKLAKWYWSNDLIRLLEPFCALPFQLFIFLESELVYLHFSQSQKVAKKEFVAVVLLFSFFAALYQQGAGFHSASNYYKNVLETSIDSNPTLITDYPEIVEIYNWMRDVWQHTISHYMYAAGGIGMSFVQIFIFRNATSYSTQNNLAFASVSHQNFYKKNKFLFGATVLSYAAIIVSVAINFPLGSIVALILSGAGSIVLTTFLIMKSDFKHHNFFRKVFNFNSFPILQAYLFSYMLSIIGILCWICKYGFFANRLSAANNLLLR